jgi:hypothetical protein
MNQRGRSARAQNQVLIIKLSRGAPEKFRFKFMTAKKFHPAGKPERVTATARLAHLKRFLALASIAGVLASAGCASWNDRDHARDADHARAGPDQNYSTGVDHGEFPGDMNHDEDP